MLMYLRKLRQNDTVVYLEDSIDNENKDGKLTLKDSIQDDFEIDEYCETQEMKQMVSNTVLEKLDGRQRQIIILRYGLFGNTPQTQQQICEMLGISRSYVSRLEKKAVEILREQILNQSEG